MRLEKLTKKQQSVLKTLETDHLTSYEILQKVDNIKLILALYRIMDELRNMGAIRSYKKKNIKYHYAY